MKRKRLGVNIDHVATVRNARGENYPDPLNAAIVAQKSGADSITIHLREDRRHIKDYDLKNIKKKIKIPLNLEMAPTKEMLKIAIKYKPNFVCLVPEKRSEITTEGGLNIKKNKKYIKKIIQRLKKYKIRVSLFIEPNIIDIKLSQALGANCVELHTGKFASSQFKDQKAELSKLIESTYKAKSVGLRVNAGHGLTYQNVEYIASIPGVEELNIGHTIISRAIAIGLKEAVREMKEIITNPRNEPLFFSTPK